MVKNQRLKWIPMLIQAINEVRNEVQTRGNWPQETHAEVKTELPVRGTSTEAKPVKKRQKTKTPVRRGQHIARKPKVVSTKRPITIAQYRAVLRELRETKQKLGQLSVIDDRLNQLQANLEQQWADLLKRMETQTSKQTNQNANRIPDHSQDPLYWGGPQGGPQGAGPQGGSANAGPHGGPPGAGPHSGPPSAGP